MFIRWNHFQLKKCKDLLFWMILMKSLIIKEWKTIQLKN